MSVAPEEEVTNAILKYAGNMRWNTPSVRAIEQFVLKPMMEARMGMEDIKTHYNGFPLRTETHLAALCDIVINAEAAAAGDPDKRVPPGAEYLIFARTLKEQYNATTAGQVASLSNEEFAAALELTMAGEVSRGRRGALGMMEGAQRLERI